MFQGVVLDLEDDLDLVGAAITTIIITIITIITIIITGNCGFIYYLVNYEMFHRKDCWNWLYFCTDERCSFGFDSNYV